MTTWLEHLQRRLRGDITDDLGVRALYAADASNHRVVPRYVARPVDAEDVAVLVRASADEGVPVTSRGAGTNCAGNAIGPGVVLDLSHAFNRVLAVDPDARVAVVEPGAVLDRLQEAAAPSGLLFGVDPSTHSRCTLGGMIGTNACGSHSIAWGTTADNVLSLDVVLPDGSSATLGPDSWSTTLGRQLGRVRDTYLGDIRTELGRFPRQISGYGLQYLRPERGGNAAQAFAGSEGTCAVITSATVRLHQRPVERRLVVLGFADEVAAAQAAPHVAALGALTVEGMDDEVVATADLRARDLRRPQLPRGRAWLLAEVGGTESGAGEEIAAALGRAASDLGALGVSVIADAGQQRAVWAVRERGAGLASRSLAGREFWPGWEDSAVPPHRLGDYLADFRRLLSDHGRSGMIYGHFGEGCVHVRIDHDLLSESGRAEYRVFQEAAAELVVTHGGSLSGEHGDGRARSELLDRMYGARVLSAFAAFKHAFDPSGLMNPGVLVDPDPLDANLRLAVVEPYKRDLGFLYPDDAGDFAKALRRCTGVGACRKTSGGSMCPSFRATGEERDSTRGRSRLLAEMIDGRLVPNSWESDAVEQALDLCLSCKACSAECPVGVDMATYKSEFLHQRYRRRLRPRAHYAMGWLPVTLRLARLAPRVANLLLAVPGAQALARRLGGIDSNRALPRIATERSVRSSLAREARFWSGRRGSVGDPVLLWVDTFTASFAPEVARSAVQVLEHAGYRVELAPRGVCCGLTWTSTGQLGVARRVLKRTIRLLDRASQRMPIVALEPSCAAALRHDARNLLGGEEVTRVAGRVRSLAELLVERPLPLSKRDPVTAVAQFHCHQRATTGTEADKAVLAAAGVEVTAAPEGCCGLAGNFGFEDGHYDVSVSCAEEALLPAIRAHDGSGPVVADGFSCRLQVEQLAGHRPQHLAEVLADRLPADETAQENGA